MKFAWFEIWWKYEKKFSYEIFCHKSHYFLKETLTNKKKNDAKSNEQEIIKGQHYL